MMLSLNIQYEAEIRFEEMLRSSDAHLNEDFKTFLSTFIEEVKLAESDMSSVKHLDKDDLYSDYIDSKKLSLTFDKLHQSYYEKQYLHDDDLKRLLKTTAKNLHKLENLFHKYYTKYLPVEKTPEYIKSGLIQYSHEVLKKKLSS